MRIEIDFKHQDEPRLRCDFRVRTDPVIRAVTWDLAFWLFVTYHVTLVVTCLYRPPEENRRAGGSDTSRHLEKPCRAIDIRIRDWPKSAVDSAVRYLNNHWGDLLYVLDEDSHLHIQLSRKAFPDGSLK